MSIVDFLLDFAFRRIVIGTSTIGVAAGVMGCHLYVRKQSLLSDVVGHSSVAGVMGAFIAVAALGGSGRSMIAVIIGALISGFAAVLIAETIDRHSRVGIDAAMAVMLALFFGGGLVLLQVIQLSTLPGKGGLASVMFGNAATLTYADVWTIATVAIVVLSSAAVLHRPFSVLNVDFEFAQTIGWKPKIISPIQLLLVVLALVLGIKAVGLVLMLAFAIFPASAARLWTTSINHMMVVAGVIGVFSAVVGSYLSVAVYAVPTGPVIVVVLFIIVVASLAVVALRDVLKRKVQAPHA